jgi:hypothetical protein
VGGSDQMVRITHCNDIDACQKRQEEQKKHEPDSLCAIPGRSKYNSSTERC